MKVSSQPIFTIGHSTHAIGVFLAFLDRYGVTVLADVRSAPYSRFNPQFNRDAIKQASQAAGIKYVFLGQELGARSNDPACYELGRVRYDRLARTDLFKSGIERVMRSAKTHRVALMCAEKEPLECHRTLLVARVLKDLHADVRHILADGGTESYEASMERLLQLLGLPQQDLFRSRELLVEEALRRQEERVAFVDEKQLLDSTRDAT